MMKNYRLLILFLAFSVCAYAQAPKYSNEFLNVGVGARALGMSNSYVASVNDVTAGYWNPAGLSGIGNQHQIVLMHNEYYAGIGKYDYAAYATRIDSSSVLGLTVIRFGIDNIPNTTQLMNTTTGTFDYSKITHFSAVDYAFMLSYSKTLKIPGLTAGANAKIIRRKIGDFAGAWGFGIDAGLQYHYKKWLLAAMARDVTSTFNAWTFNLSDETKAVFNATGNDIPTNSVEVTLPKLLLGGARQFDFPKNISLLAEANVDATFDGKRNVLVKSNIASLDPHIGIEVAYLKTVFLRAGIGNYQSYKDIAGKKVQILQPNMGVGLKIKSVTIDYAFTNVADKAYYSHVFSVKADINKKH